MKNLITVEQQKVIENLANEGHYDALIAFGADMYRSGIRKGAIIGVVASLMGVGAGAVVAIVDKKKKAKLEQK